MGSFISNWRPSAASTGGDGTGEVFKSDRPVTYGCDFGTGHHLPTFLRTYGGRNLLRLYQIRLLVLPLLLLFTQTVYLHLGWSGLELVLSL